MSLTAPPEPAPTAAPAATLSAPASRTLTILLGAILCLQGLGVSLALPALPAIADALQARPDMVQLTVSAYMAGVAAMQLVYGALSDRFGRRPVLLAGVALHALGGLGCVVAPSIGSLLVLRAVQGVGAAAAAVLGRAMIRDLYDGHRAVRMMGIMGGIMSVVPLVAPLLGGGILAAATAWSTFVPWRVVFAVMGLASTVTWLVSLRLLRETLRHRDPHATHPGRLLANCWHFLTRPGAAALAGTLSFSGGAMFGYSATASLVFIRVLGVPASQLGWVLLVTGLAMVAGSMVASRLAGRWPVRRLLDTSACLALASSATLLVVTTSNLRGPACMALVLLSMVVFAFSLSPQYATALTLALRPVPHMAGVATALCGTLQMGYGAFSVWLGGRLFDGTPRALGLCVATGAVLSALSYGLGARRHVREFAPG